MAKVGDYNMTSDRSGFVYPRSEMRQEWTGRWVHYSEWEPQQPQEIITPKKDNQRVWPVRDEQPVVNVQPDNSTSPLIFKTTANSNTVIFNGGYSAKSLADSESSESSDDGSASSAILTQNANLTGVRFTLNTSELTSAENYFSVGFTDGQYVSSSTKSLFVVIQYIKATSEVTVLYVGNIITGDSAAPLHVLSTYTDGDQLCISIKNGGYVQFDTPDYSVNYTTSPTVEGLKYFSVVLYGIDATINISQATSVYPTIADYTVSSIPYIPPSQLDSY